MAGGAGAGATGCERVMVRCVIAPADTFAGAAGLDAGPETVAEAGSLSGAGAATGFSCVNTASSSKAATRSAHKGTLRAGAVLTIHPI